MGKPFLGFWENLPRPIVGLAPMDGVTDFAFRHITAKYGRPHVIFTEFVTAEGLLRAPERILPEFEFCEIERPVVAQIFGHDPDHFYKAAIVVCQLGFDGIDINMGCPSKQIVKQQCGAALIQDPRRARDILQAVATATEEGGNKKIPYSVKTRLGVDTVVIEKWMETLLSEKPAVISIHGRTLKQMYKGRAEWSPIERAASVARGSGTYVLGNGDVRSLEEARRRAETHGVEGVLIGRAAIGNPWIFRNQTADKNLRIQTALEHARYYVTRRPEKNFKSLNKHLIQYLSGFPGASRLRLKAVQARDFEALERLFASPDDPLPTAPGIC